jgi:hypothetical protein
MPLLLRGHGYNRDHTIRYILTVGLAFILFYQPTNRGNTICKEAAHTRERGCLENFLHSLLSWMLVTEVDEPDRLGSEWTGLTSSGQDVATSVGLGLIGT